VADGRRGPIVAWIIPLVIGMVGFSRVAHSSNFEMYRTVDIVQLLGSGVCFGAALVGIIFILRRTRG
jgi:hypothetical protein